MMKAQSKTKETSLITKPHKDAFLYMTAETYGQILEYVFGCSIEISGMGQLKPYKNGYLVTNVYMIKQTCSSVETNLDTDALGVLDYECTDGLRSRDGDMIWWWHSHHDMEAYWSGTDYKAISQLSGKGCRVVATVFNRKFDMRTAYSQGASLDGEYPAAFMDDLVTAIIPTEDTIDEINENVSRIKPVKTTAKKQQSLAFGDSCISSMTSEPSEWEQSWEAAIKKNNDMFPKTPAQEVLAIDQIIGSLAVMFNLTGESAEDVYDDFCDTCGSEPESIEELSLHYETNYIQGE